VETRLLIRNGDDFSTGNAGLHCIRKDCYFGGPVPPKKILVIRGSFYKSQLFSTGKRSGWSLRQKRPKIFGVGAPKFFIGLYLGNGEELNMLYSNHYCCPRGGEFDGILQFDLDPISEVKFRKFANMIRKHRPHSDVTGATSQRISNFGNFFRYPPGGVVLHINISAPSSWFV
jgi:hypothetical protein